MTTYEKRGCFHLPVPLFWPTTANSKKNKQRNIHVEVYRYTVKCASEDMVSPRSTLRRVYTTPRGVTPALSWLAISIVVVRRVQKQSVSNAFPICSAPPCSSAHLSMHHSHHGQIAGTKVQILFVNIRP